MNRRCLHVHLIQHGIACGALLLLLVAGASRVSAADLTWKTLPADELAEGWISLFDGETLFGWRPNETANWRVADGTITVDSGKACLLCTTTQFDDYVLRLEFRSPEQTNSGVFLRTPPSPKDPAADCLEWNIAPADNPFPTGSLVKRKKYSGAGHHDDWRNLEATLQGTHVSIKLDGETVLEYNDPTALGRGFIGLQYNSGEVAFRNIRLKPLGLKPLLDAELKNWTAPDDQAGKFEMNEGELHVQNGPGQLETRDLYGNFFLQLAFKTHAEHLNSGLFFRCIPGDKMMGYESQIHQGYKDGDRTQPVDCGTGGVFRRVNARTVVGNDQEWVYKTLIVDGPHVATWVNGLQVTDWVDRRPADENPRKGLRLAPGSVMLQAHDPTTDLSFRDLQVRESAARRLAPAKP
ncbi:3-keto-disaccharide hydrolase [Lignipirellula cremea]|uniref:3-keto-alpha-glucoside-1,2-lyase/3-keto-2-hydroxy-glucal hydratase domain-containing protein n=1 Tax=Lignipirellula cremea TaxID=2528010 RepID=A0A518DR57_9BACT|nr:DUF1080 domain-containing protein [Lignipirellula cremea]QDU94325.1 hypothetical protein Pla8534_21140 [Lignipirellula cremea]